MFVAACDTCLSLYLRPEVGILKNRESEKCEKPENAKNEKTRKREKRENAKNVKTRKTRKRENA